MTASDMPGDNKKQYALSRSWYRSPLNCSWPLRQREPVPSLLCHGRKAQIHLLAKVHIAVDPFHLALLATSDEILITHA
jgi:hypothetical protein